ncbi:RNA polymerase sigma factor [Acidaminococcus massiliensis]|uniref:RNA polymerase sigma factor n=1 Tax=Acidaminococcus massiliensis TaxID=1852375 RepID=UPI00248DF6B0|nr:sigma-70 family RNA polymerase sigma factor [Acidaminococcus massiliensis]
MANQEKTRVKEQYFIPLEVKEGTIITKEFEDAPRMWSKIGNRKVRTILVPANKEQYEAYMRPEWKEDKRQQRLVEKRRRREMAQAEHRKDKSVQGWDTAVSFEQLCETEYGFPEKTGEESLDEILEKEELLAALRRELAKLETLDRTILEMFSQGISEAAIGHKVGLSQKGVNKRKHRLLEQLREQLKDYR